MRGQRTRVHAFALMWPIVAPSACQTAFNIDGVDASSRRHCNVPRWWCDQPLEEAASMEQVEIIGIDLAKRSFQLHGARADGSVAFRRKVSREKLPYFARRTTTLRCGDGGLCERSPLGPRDYAARPRCEAGPADLREAVRESTVIPRHLATLLKMKDFCPGSDADGNVPSPEPEQPPQNRAHRPISPTAHPCRPDGREQHRAGSAGSLSWH